MSETTTETEYPIQTDTDLVERSPMSRDEMNALLEAEGMAVRIRDEPKDHQSSKNNQHIARIFQSATKQQTVTNPNKDRSLSGKARRKARRAR